jgi:hypothetical protein
MVVTRPYVRGSLSPQVVHCCACKYEVICLKFRVSLAHRDRDHRMAGDYRCSSDCARNTNKQPTQDNTKPPANRGGVTQGRCTHRADEVVAYALGEGAVGQEERRRATMLVCRGRKTRVSRAESSAVADEVFDETRHRDTQRVDDVERPD